MSVKKSKLTIEEVGTTIGIIPDRWRGRCHEISMKLVQAGVVDGKAVYGYFRGIIAAGTYFNASDNPRQVPIKHGWIERADGRVVDPTRWVFEGKKPYLWISDKPAVECEEYDLAGNGFEKISEGAPPQFDFKDSRLAVMDQGTASILNEVLADASVVVRQLGHAECDWLAHLNPQKIGVEKMKPIYQLLDQLGMRVWVPIDNWAYVMGHAEGF